MTLERGFRRLAIAVSVIVAGLGITLDAVSMLPHATVQATLQDGRKYTVQRHERRESLADREAVAGALPKEAWPPEQAIKNCERIDRVDGNRGTNCGTMQAFPEVKEVRMLRTEYWYWADTVWTKVAAVLVALLWGMFLSVRWVARGFVG